MRQVKAKLRSNRGETLVEVLAAILVATLSVGLLMGGVAASSAINRQADHSDESFYETLTAAESRTGTSVPGSVRVAEGAVETSIPVLVYGDEDLRSYALDPGGGGT